MSNRLGYTSQLLEFPLIDNKKNSLWQQHSVHGQKVDVAVIKLDLVSELNPYPINEMPSVDMQVDIGMDVFVLGFPIKTFTGVFPIWTRGTIATEYDIYVDGMPKFLIDTATQKGMSGSPVILRESNYTDSTDGQNKLSIPPAKRFLGVYSGRYGSNDSISAQIGIVWRKEVIDEIIDAGVLGTYEIR